ncbi:MAG: PorV/PorQ family protein [Bacteroidetes bacterium]|nr:PorV/PorQ family protein [Bacteroidota bacterium]
MRNKIIILLLLLPSYSFGQYGYGFLKEHFFGRQNSARAEAMGKSYTSIDGDLATAYFNPAGVATIQDLEISGSLASPYYLLKKAKYDYIGIGFKFKDYLTIGLNRKHFNFGEDFHVTDNTGNPLMIGESFESNYCLTLASQPIKNLFIGLNSNYFEWQIVDINANTLYWDLGIIKKFNLAQKETIKQSINLGTSLVNINGAKIEINEFGNKYRSRLPMILRIGANYQIHLQQKILIDTLNSFTVLIQGEYQDVVNSKYESAIRSGIEFMLLEILSLRAGYYKEFEYDYGIPSVNYDQISAFTYGFGIQVPLYKLTKIPLNINFDYTSLPQQPYSNYNYNLDNFTTYNVRLNWLIKNK